MIKTKDLTFSYDKSARMAFPDIDCKAGEVRLILGPSGSGKTTLLNVLGGLLSPDIGQVIIGDVDVHSLSNIEKDRFRGKNIGLVFQTAHFIRSLSVAENLRLCQRLAGVRPSEERIDKLLTRLNILEHKNKKTDEISVGEQQRLAIVRALINQPKVILADEPTSALDDDNCEEVIKLLQTESKEANAALLIVTHDNRLKDIINQRIVLEKLPQS